MRQLRINNVYYPLRCLNKTINPLHNEYKQKKCRKKFLCGG